MTATLHKDLPMKDYHEHKADSKSTLKVLIDDCPARYLYEKNNPKEFDTKSTSKGSVAHTLALEPEHLEKTYHFTPKTYFNDKGEELPWRNDARMQVYKDELEKAGTKPMVGYNEFEDVKGMANALRDDEFAIALLKAEGYVEASIFWDETVTLDDGTEIIIPMKCRPDLMRNDGLIVDLKTCRAAKPELFHKDAFNLHYALSIAITARGYKALYGKDINEYVFLAVENEAPYFVESYSSFAPLGDMTDMSYFDFGKVQLDKLLKILAQCRYTGVYPKYQDKITPMRIPSWAMKQFMMGDN